MACLALLGLVVSSNALPLLEDMEGQWERFGKVMKTLTYGFFQAMKGTFFYE
jgi:hypothetical protein